MTTNKKAAPAASAGTAKENPANSPNFTIQDDPLRGWLELGKTARLRQQKKPWLKKNRGAA